MTIPDNSPFLTLQSAPYFSIDADRPSLYKVIAFQTKYPTGLNTQEFIAYQALFSSKYRPWPYLLIELRSSNLNFSTEAVSLLVCRLSSYTSLGFEVNPLPAIQKIFQNNNFC